MYGSFGIHIFSPRFFPKFNTYNWLEFEWPVIIFKLSVFILKKNTYNPDYLFS